jgi:hypothetical protein
MCAAGDKYLATGGIIVLQDAVELVFLAVLMEREVDETEKLESMTFDQMIGSLRSIGLTVKKSGTLKAMNKLRVTAKHYGQLMEPVTVQGHVNVASFAIDELLKEVIGRSLRDVYLTELVSEGETRGFLELAARKIEQELWMEALVEIRKAIFLNFEQDYCIYPFRETERDSRETDMLGFLAGGWKAPLLTKNKEWIRGNVKTPCDYVQVDYERMRLDAMEWGINTQVLQNVRRLTPDAVRLEVGGSWYVRFDAAFPANSATRENASYCLDLAIDAIRRKALHHGAIRVPAREKSMTYPPAYVGQDMYDRPTVIAPVLRTLLAEDRYVVQAIMNGFDPNLVFYRIECTTSDGVRIYGYVQRLSQPLETPGEVPPVVASG